MSRPVLLASEGLWTALRRLARRSAGPRLVAVPFVGKGAARLLPLQHGDTLLCALTKANSGSGSVCPSELLVLRRRGVRLYQQPDLHAKVFLFGTSAVVGSPNLSLTSRDTLDETAVVVRDRRFVSEVRRWFDDRLTESISPGWLDECAAVYRPPRNRGTRKGRARHVRKTPQRRIWLVGVEPMDFPADENRSYREGERTARRRLSRPRSTDVETIRWSHAEGLANRLNDGDLMIQVWDEGTGQVRRVFPAGKVLHVKRVRSRRRSMVLYVYLELPRRYRRIAWPRFKRICRSFGLRLRKNVYQREIRDRIVTHRLLELTAPERLRLR